MLGVQGRAVIDSRAQARDEIDSNRIIIVIAKLKTGRCGVLACAIEYFFHDLALGAGRMHLNADLRHIRHHIPQLFGIRSVIGLMVARGAGR